MRKLTASVGLEKREEEVQEREREEEKRRDWMFVYVWAESYLINSLCVWVTVSFELWVLVGKTSDGHNFQRSIYSRIYLLCKLGGYPGPLDLSAVAKRHCALWYLIRNQLCSHFTNSTNHELWISLRKVNVLLHCTSGWYQLNKPRVVNIGLRKVNVLLHCTSGRKFFKSCRRGQYVI